MKGWRQLPLKLLRGLWIGLIGLVLIFEEWGWEPLARLVARIGALPGLRWIESLIRALPPYGALALFAVPVLTLLPIKVLALYWLGHGHTVLGIGVIACAKVGGTAISARLFMLTKPTLMRLAWFARWLGRWITWKTRVVSQVKSSALWHSVDQFKQRTQSAAKIVIHRLRQWLD
ncbi:MAG: hypothetical protein KGL90_00085 [Burkholderiales bacterium]|nr:hypothetical protein [Burkholderiales bacterium]